MLLSPQAATVDLTIAAATVTATALEDDISTALATGDLTGDGVDDLLIGAPRSCDGGLPAGFVAVYSGPLSGNLTPADADALLVGTFYSQAGHRIATGDGDGDGVADALIGAPAPNARGGAYLVSGPLNGTIALFDTPVPLLGEASGDELGAAVAQGDVDGDGLADLALGAPGHGDPDAGAVYLVLGRADGAWETSPPEATILGDEGYLLRDDVLLADTDGDGTRDLVLATDLGRQIDPHAWLTCYGYYEIRPFQGALSGVLELSGADAVLGDDGSYAAMDLAAGDLDGDGADDLAWVKWTVDQSYQGRVHTWIFYGGP